jgi:hypothetical protein
LPADMRSASAAASELRSLETLAGSPQTVERRSPAESAPRRAIVAALAVSLPQWRSGETPNRPRRLRFRPLATHRSHSGGSLRCAAFRRPRAQRLNARVRHRLTVAPSEADTHTGRHLPPALGVGRASLGHRARLSKTKTPAGVGCRAGEASESLRDPLRGLRFLARRSTAQRVVESARPQPAGAAPQAARRAT